MKWQELITQLLDNDLQISPLEAEARTGIKYQNFDRWTRGEVADPQPKIIRDLQQGLGIRITRHSKGDYSYQHSIKDKAEIKNITYNSFPVISVVRAGQPNGVRENEILYYAEFNYSNREGVFAVLVEGDSMSPELKHGDIVLVDKYVEPLPDSIVLAVFENDEHTIKKYRPLVEDYIELIPVNKNYNRQIIQKSKVSAIYRVVRSLRSH